MWCSYVGETKRQFQIRLSEHHKYVEQGKTDKSGVAKNTWNKHYRIKWSKVLLEAKKVQRSDVHATRQWMIYIFYIKEYCTI